MKLGVITSLWAYAENLSLIETLERIAQLGLQHVDLLGFLHGNPLELSQAQKKEVRQTLESFGQEPGSLVMLPPGNIASPHEDEIEKCMQYVVGGMDFIAFLGGWQILFNGGLRTTGVDHAESWKRSSDFMHRAAEHAQKVGVYITVEAEPYVYFLVHDTETTLRMVQEVNHPHLMATVDVGHMNLSRDAPSGLAPLLPWIARLHLSENDGRLHANDILGTGNVPLGETLRELQTMHVEGTCEILQKDLVAVMELGVLGDDFEDTDAYAKRSMMHALEVAPFLTL